MIFITKKNLLTFSSILIFIGVKVNSLIIPLEKLSLGDTVNKQNFNKTSAVVYGNIINFNNEIPFKVKLLTKSIKNSPKWSLIQYTCSKTLNSLFNDPIDNINLFKIFDKQKLNYELFDIDQKYLNNNYTCILFELCEFEKQTYKEFVSLFDEKFFEKYNSDDYYYYNENYDHTKYVNILKFIRGNETHYISSTNNGDCLFQIFIFNTEPKNIINNISKNKSIDYLKQTPKYTSKIVMANNNHTYENIVMNYLNNSNIFLFNFANYPLQIKSDIINYLKIDNIISVELTALPKLPKSLDSLKINNLLPNKQLNWMQLKPGDRFNIKNIQSDSVFINGNMLDFILFNTIQYINLYNYQITNYSDINMDKSSLSCHQFITKYYSDDNKKNIEKLKPFDCWLNEKFYGIDKKFFNKNYKRNEIKICHIIEEKKIAIDSLDIIYLTEKSIDFDYNILENENFILRFPKGNETHYISSIEIGDCLYQALVYNSDGDYSEEKLVHKGRILSASKDSQLEQWIEVYLNGLNKTDNSLYQIYSNETIRSDIINKLDKKAVVNINFRSIYKKRTIPLLNSNEYHNFKNLSQNLSIKNYDNFSQELLTAVFQNLSQSNEAFKTFTENLFTAIFKNLSEDLFSNLSSNLPIENPQQLLQINSSQNLYKKRSNLSNSLQPSLLNITLYIITVYILLIVFTLISSHKL